MRLGQAQQRDASRAQRLSQLEDAFRVVKSVEGVHVMLADDVITAGSTLEAAGRALKAAAVKHVSVAVFAQA